MREESALKGKRRAWLEHAAFAGGGILLTLLLLECFLRLWRPVDYRRPPAPRLDDPYRVLLHRRSAIAGLAYELAPNIERFARGALNRTNSFGMRDREPHVDGGRRMRRMAVLGDSFTFGWGVSVEQTYPDVLEKLLNESNADAGTVFDVLNFGDGGYGTRDEVLVLEHKALRWKPEVVVLSYVLNDPETDPVSPLHDYYQKVEWWQHSHLLRLLAKARRNWDVLRWGNGDYFKYLHAPGSPKWQGLREAFTDLRRLASGGGAQVLVVIFPWNATIPWRDYPYGPLHKQVADLARAEGFHALDLLEAWSKHPPQQLTLNADDEHPSPLGHRVAAEAILEKLRAANTSLLPRTAAQPRR